MVERRRAERKDLVYYSRVSDQVSGRDLGNLINITPEGAMVWCERPVEVGKAMHLIIELPEGLACKSRLEVDAKSLWCREDVNPEFYDVGFGFADVSTDDAEIIKCLVEKYSFSRERGYQAY